MSGFISIAFPEGAIMLTDAASYDETGVVKKIASKVARANTAPFAITTRGNAVFGETLRSHLCAEADSRGVDGVIACLPGMIDYLASQPDLVSGDSYEEVSIGAWSLKEGAVNYGFMLGPSHRLAAVPGNKLTKFEGKAFIGGPDFSDDPGKVRHIPVKLPNESGVEYMRRHGSDWMEAMRKESGMPRQSERPQTFQAALEIEPQYLIGGFCELTVVTAAGAFTETVKVWNDRVGQKIDPFAIGNVAKFTGMNRQQRRAAERPQRAV